MVKSQYRADIDGLRAIAVLSILTFHLKESWLPGGFTGVDIFFVISGYLITAVIYQEMNNDRFSLKDFYARRLKRIFPVMWVMMFVVLIFGILLFPPGDLSFLVNAIRAAISLTSNHFFAKSGDYFNADSSTWPLLHMWSLSVEEQFYFIWPLLLLGLFKIKTSHRTKINLLSFLTAISFIGCEIYLRSGAEPKWAYYALPFRFGELSLGAALTLMVSKGFALNSKLHNVISTLGLILLSSSFYFVNSQTQFPGVTALLPCLGAVFLIISEKSLFNQKVLASKFFVWVGQHSYSIYLWHWPILAFMRYFGSISYLQMILAVALTMALSMFSKKHIEDRFRYSKRFFASIFFRYYAAPAIISLTLVIVIYDSGGFPLRYSFKGIDAANELSHDSYCDGIPLGKCLLGDRNKKTATLLLGDSHARQFHGFFETVGKKDGFSVVTIAMHKCSPTLVREEGESSECEDRKTWLLNNISSFKTVIVAARWDNEVGDYAPSAGMREIYKAHLKKMFEYFVANKLRVILIPEIIKYEDDNFRLISKTRYSFMGYGDIFLGKAPRPDIDPASRKATTVILEVAKEFKNVQIFSPLEIAGTETFPYAGDWLMYKDNNHFNNQGSIFLAENYLKKRTDKYSFQ